MRRFLASASTMILLSTSTFACSSSSSNPPSSTANEDAATHAQTSDASTSGTCASGAGTTVAAKWDFAVSAASNNGGKGQVLTAHLCDTVVWTNDDNGIAHSVVSTGGGFTFSTPVATGTTAGVALSPVRFTSKGTFTYDCGVHGMMMIGQITID